MASNKAATWIAFRSVVLSSLATSTRMTAQFRRQRILTQAPHHQTIAPTTPIHARDFTSNRLARPDDSADSGTAAGPPARKAKAATKRAANNSLRKVAVEAQRSRLGRSFIKGSGRTRHVDPEADTKEVTAYCAAETYNLFQARWELQKEGYAPDPCGTGLFPQVLHVQTHNFLVKDEETGQTKEKGEGDIFVFPSGCVVTWNVPEGVAHNLVHRILPGTAGETGHLEKLEVEDLEFLEDSHGESSRILGDTIILGTQASAQHHEDEDISTTGDKDEYRSPSTDTALAKIAFSSALARSTKLAVLENALNAYFTSTRDIPLTLAAGKKVRINRSQILQKTGELLLIRAQLNLYSELTDSLPDLFWDSPHELGLEGYYEMVGKALDVGVRIKSLNEKMDYASEIATILRERSSEKHSAMLEWMIIGLICIEVGFGMLHLWREGITMSEKEEERRTRELLEVWLERELAINKA